jgi:hypothetical protein
LIVQNLTDYKLKRIMKAKLSKILTPNDTGSNGSHQAGILIPKDGKLLSFFPELGNKTLNPFIIIKFASDHGIWEFKFIYYNNKFFKSAVSGKLGTRNEYRLTCMTKFMRSMNLKPGDSLIFNKDDRQVYTVSCKQNYLKNFEIKSDNLWEVEFA